MARRPRSQVVEGEVDGENRGGGGGETSASALSRLVLTLTAPSERDIIVPYLLFVPAIQALPWWGSE